MKQIKVLYVLNEFSIGGGEAFCSGAASSVPPSVRIDFAVEKLNEQSDLYKKLNSLGTVFYVYPKVPGRHGLLNLFSLYKVIKSGHYDIVHSHRDYFNGGVLLCAKLAGVKRRISHAHLSCDGHFPFFKRIYISLQKALIRFAATDLWACSDTAGKCLYGCGKFKIINNFVDSSHFAYNPALRAQTRKRFNLENNFVICHIGRFCKEKNHMFLLDVFAEVLKKDPAARLVLIGGGELENDIKKYAESLKITDKTIFAGFCKDTSPFLQAADLFAFPSLSEGFGIASIEAQASGLPCLLAEGLDRHMAIINSYILPLDKNIWAERILSLKNVKIDRLPCAEEIKQAGFDIAATAEVLAKEYTR